MTEALVEPDGVGVALRAVTIGATLLLVGALPVSAVVLRSARGRGEDLVPGLRRILRGAAAAVALAAAGTLVHVVAVLRGVLTDVSASAAWQQILASDLGAWTALRIPVGVFAWLVLPAALSTASTSSRPSRTAWGSWALLAGVLTLSLPMTSHAGSSGGLAVVVDAVHLLSGAVWLAGVVALALVVPLAVRSGRSSERRAVLLSSATAFSRLAVVAVTLAVVTGVAQGVLSGVPLASLAGSSWGAAVTAKVWLFAVVLAAGLANHRVLIRRLDAARSRARVETGSAALLSVVSLEVVLGVAMVLAAALLVSVPQP